MPASSTPSPPPESSASSPLTSSSGEEGDLLARVRHIRLPQPPVPTSTVQEGGLEVARLSTHPDLPVPAVLQLPAQQGEVQPPVPAAASALHHAYTPPPPTVNTTALPASSSSSSTVVAPVADRSSRSLHAPLATLPSGSTVVTTSSHSGPPPLLVQYTQLISGVEDSGEGTKPREATDDGNLAAPTPSAHTAVGARPPPLTVTVLTAPPPGSAYTSAAVGPISGTASRSHALPLQRSEPSALMDTAAPSTVEVVDVKRRKRALEGRGVYLFQESLSDDSAGDESASPRPQSPRDLFTFLGNVVTTADAHLGVQRGVRGGPSPSRSGVSRSDAEEERKKRKKRTEQARAHPPLIIRRENVQGATDVADVADVGESAEKEGHGAAASEERSMSSQSTNALTPDQKAQLGETRSPGAASTATAATTPEKDVAAEQATPAHVEPQLRPRRTHHRRYHDKDTDGHDTLWRSPEGLPTTNQRRDGLHRNPRLHREDEDPEGSAASGEDVPVDAPAHEMTRPACGEVPLPDKTTFVSRLSRVYGNATWTGQTKRLSAKHTDPQDVCLSGSTELAHRGFCKSGAFDDDSSSTLPSLSARNAAPASPPTVAASRRLPECLLVTVRGMSPMHADVNVVHPFARVWLVNCRTGENLVSSRDGAPFAVTHLFDLRQRQTRAPLWDAELALPLNQAHLRAAPKEAVLLIEVLDICTETVTGEFVPRSGVYPICWGYYYLYDRYGNSNVSPERGDSATSPIHLQMFRFPLRTPWYVQLWAAVVPPLWASPAVWAPFDYLSSGGVLHTTAQATLGISPDATANEADEATGGVDDSPRDRRRLAFSRMVIGVYAIFRSPQARKVPYEAGLSVSLRFVQDRGRVRTRLVNATDYEAHLTRQLASMAGQCVVPRLHDAQQGCSHRASPASEPLHAPTPQRVSEELQRHRMSLCVVDEDALAQTYERVGMGERCLPPTRTIQTCPVAGAVTCMAFSRAGTLLAFGVTRHLQHLVELRLPLLADFPVAARLDAHTAHVYHVAFNADDTKLLSCSSDNTVRIWMGTDGYNFADVSPQVRTLSVTCVCVLPHRWPMYTAAFHSFQLYRRRHTADEFVITGGYSNKLVTWRLSDAPHQQPRSASVSLTVSGDRRGGHDTDAAQFAAHDGRQTCELVSRVSVAENAFVLEVASTNGSNRVWSVDSTGTVTCWRATIESDGFVMSVRMRSPELACTRILVSSSTVVAFKPKSAAVFLFDATSGKPLRNKPPPIATDCASFALLPDGSGFAGGTSTGRLRCWNWETSTLFPCTGHDGYRGAEVQYPVERIAWASGEHLVAMASAAPCPECYLNTVLLPEARPADEFGAFPQPLYDLSQLEVTLVTIAGAPQPVSHLPPPKVRLVDFVRLFGGDAAAVQRARAAHGQRPSSPGQHSAVLIERFDDDDAEDPTTVLSRAMAQVDAQLNSIVQFWLRAFAGTTTPSTARPDRYRATDLEDAAN